MTPAFTVSQSALTPSNVTVNDTSTSITGTITKRRIFFQTTDGDYLVEDGTTTNYEEWPLAETTKTWDILSTDKALSITVQWLNVSDVVVEFLTQIFAFPQYNKNFFYYLIQQQALTPEKLRDKVYFSNLATYWMCIVAGIQAIEIGADVAASQANLDRATLMQENESMYF